MTATSASVQFAAAAWPRSSPTLRLTGQHLHPAATPTTITRRSWRSRTRTSTSRSPVPDTGQVTEEDVTFGRLLAKAVNQYVAELEKLAAADHEPGGSRCGSRAGGVMARLMEAGRLELVPPAAPGFSPVCTKEVTSVCARS